VKGISAEAASWIGSKFFNRAEIKCRLGANAALNDVPSYEPCHRVMAISETESLTSIIECRRHDVDDFLIKSMLRKERADRHGPRSYAAAQAGARLVSLPPTPEGSSSCSLSVMDHRIPIGHGWRVKRR
jgi:hypothetical protein